ncbi:MAG TPA: hypothetical protein VFV23_08750 [Verrucomicrobiae bacterium]|nr:hypothetical protein [Verrucomicrobiae bacterium]
MISDRQINEWLAQERKRKAEARRRETVLDSMRERTRKVFVFLLLGTLLVLLYDHRVKIQTLAFEKLRSVQQKSMAHDSLRQSAIQYENHINDVAK